MGLIQDMTAIMETHASKKPERNRFAAFFVGVSELEQEWNGCLEVLKQCRQSQNLSRLCTAAERFLAHLDRSTDTKYRALRDELNGAIQNHKICVMQENIRESANASALQAKEFALAQAQIATLRERMEDLRQAFAQERKLLEDHYKEIINRAEEREAVRLKDLNTACDAQLDEKDGTLKLERDRIERLTERVDQVAKTERTRSDAREDLLNDRKEKLIHEKEVEIEKLNKEIQALRYRAGGDIQRIKMQSMQLYGLKQNTHQLLQILPGIMSSHPGVTPALLPAMIAASQIQGTVDAMLPPKVTVAEEEEEDVFQETESEEDAAAGGSGVSEAQKQADIAKPNTAPK